MGIILLLIPVTLVLVGAAGWAFFWAVGSGQFDELDSPGWEILVDDAPPTDRSESAARPGSVTSSQVEATP